MNPQRPVPPPQDHRALRAAADARAFQRRVIRVYVAGIAAPYVLDVVKQPSEILCCTVHAPRGVRPYTAQHTHHNEVALVQMVVGELMRETGTYRVSVEADGDPCRSAALDLALWLEDGLHRDADGEALVMDPEALETAAPGIRRRLDAFTLASNPLRLGTGPHPEPPMADPLALAGDTITLSRDKAQTLLASLDGAAEVTAMLPAWNAIAPTFKTLAGIGDTLAAVDFRAPLALSRVRAGQTTLKAALAGEGIGDTPMGPVPVVTPPVAVVATSEAVAVSTVAPEGAVAITPAPPAVPSPAAASATPRAASPRNGRNRSR